HSDTPYPPGMLLPLRDGPHGRRATEQRDELAPVHSITSAARSRNSSDTVRFRAFAVLRLTANSNFSADWSGSSPGFAPFRILSTYPAARWYSAGRSAP